MQIYLSHASLPGTDATSLLEFATELDFEGLALSERDPLLSDCAAIRRLGDQARRRGLGIVIDANADLTSSESVQAAEELPRLRGLLEVGAEISAAAMRLAIGGQRVGVQRLLSTRRSAGGATSKGALRRVLKSRLVTLLGDAWRRRQRGRPYPNRGALGVASNALRALAPDAKTAGIPLAVENHWGITAWPQDLVEIIAITDSGWVGTCPDFSNFPRGVDRYRGLLQLAPRAILAHARSRRFTRDGEESSIDYARALGILTEAGFDGILCVEFLGWGDPVAGAVQTRNLIRRHAGAGR